MRHPKMLTTLGAILCVVAVAEAAAALPDPPRATPPPVAPGTLRIATYNVSLYRREAGALAQELTTERSTQAATIAAVLQDVRPDPLLKRRADKAARTTASAARRTRTPPISPTAARTRPATCASTMSCPRRISRSAPQGCTGRRRTIPPLRG